MTPPGEDPGSSGLVSPGLGPIRLSFADLPLDLHTIVTHSHEYNSELSPVNSPGKLSTPAAVLGIPTTVGLHSYS